MIKILKDLVLLFVVAIVLSGCQTLLKIQGQAAKQAANGINAVCENTDEKFRTDFLNEVNLLATPNRATFFCEGDTTPLFTQ